MKFVDKHLRFAFHVLVIFLLSAACSNSSLVTPAPVTLRIAGSTSMTRLLRELAAAYQTGHPNVLVDVRGGGSAVGLSELRGGEVELAAISWQVEDPRQSKIPVRGEADAGKVPAGTQAVPVARDAIALIVHPANRLPGLTLLQAKAIYQGETLDWSALGAPSAETVVISREDGSGTRAAFEALVMGSDRVTLSAVVMPDSQAVVDYISTHRAAIGYVTMAELSDRVRAVPVEDAAPTAANVRGGVYHLTRLLYLYVPTPTPPATRAFVDFVLSPAGQAIVARHHAALR
jgi:phosphate transport system substrate-binding protein